MGSAASPQNRGLGNARPCGCGHPGRRGPCLLLNFTPQMCSCFVLPALPVSLQQSEVSYIAYEILSCSAPCSDLVPTLARPDHSPHGPPAVPHSLGPLEQEQLPPFPTVRLLPFGTAPQPLDPSRLLLPQVGDLGGTVALTSSTSNAQLTAGAQREVADPLTRGEAEDSDLPHPSTLISKLSLAIDCSRLQTSYGGRAVDEEPGSWLWNLGGHVIVRGGGTDSH